MKKIFTVIVLFSLFLFYPMNNVQAQFGMKIGPNVGLNFNIGTGSDLKETMTGFGILFGATADMRFTPTIGLITNLQFYDNRSGSYDESGTYQGINYTVENSASIAYFVIEPLFKLTLPASNFYFVAGTGLGFNVESTGEQTLKSANGQLTFNDGSTKSKTTLKDMLVRFELKLGSGYDFVLSKLVTLTPQLTFGYGITKVQSEISARIMTIQLQTSCKFSVL